MGQFSDECLNQQNIVIEILIDKLQINHKLSLEEKDAVVQAIHKAQMSGLALAEKRFNTVN